MKRAAIVWMAGAVFGLAGCATDRVSFDEFERPPLQVAEGFEIELVAAPPLFEYPVMAGFDDRGRLFLAENAGVNFPEDELLEKLPSAIRLLEDGNGDGIFDQSTVFADKMTFPQGALWHEGALYAASPPSMWRLEDTDGDGRADSRKELATGFDFTGNAADIHGPFLSPEGRLFWCHGRKGHEVYEGERLVSKARGARIWTALPDGSDLQVFAGGGMDNPTELTFTDEGDVFGTVPLFLGSPRDDAVVHWVYGGVYPRSDQEQVLAEFKRTGDLLPPAVSLGHVAPSGILRYRSTSFGEEYRDNLFVAEFNSHRIMRIPLKRNGASFSGQPEVFLSSTSPDVHFTDLVEDADGSLLVIDTGGWFRRGCPSSGVAKPNVRGAIYRIRKTGAPQIDDPRGLEIDWPSAPAGELAGLLGDQRFAVRDRAVSELARRGESVIPDVAKALQSDNRQARLQAVWTLTRIDAEAARQAVRRALDDPDRGVRQAACRSVFTTRDAGAAAKLAALLEDVVPEVRREAAAALGRLEVGEAVPALLKAAASAGDDPMLHHGLIYALIEIDRPEPTAAGLAASESSVRRAALLALAEMESGSLSSGQVLPSLEAESPELRRAALMVVRKRPEWKEPVAALLGRWLAGAGVPPARAEVSRELITSFGNEPAVQALLGRTLGRPGLASEQRRLVLEALARTPGVTLHPSWVAPLRGLLASQDPETARAAIRLVRSTGSAELNADLERIGGDEKRDPLIRVAALQAVSGREGVLDESGYELLTRMVGSGQTVAMRVQAAEMLAEAKLSADQVSRLAPLAASAGPMELKALVRAFGKSSDEAAGVELVQALVKSQGLFGLTPGEIRRAFGGYPERVVNEAETLVAQLVRRDRDMESHLTGLRASLEEGDPQRGRQVFQSGKGNCILCHRIGETGGQVGPDLSTIGRSRSAHELLDAIVYPTESGFSRGYEAYNVTTRDNRMVFGTIPRETPEAVYIMQVAGQQMALPRDQIVKMEPSPTSLMPAGLERLMSPQELADLVAFLLSLK